MTDVKDGARPRRGGVWLGLLFVASTVGACTGWAAASGATAAAKGVVLLGNGIGTARFGCSCATGS